jgi:hypothetical protein
MPSSGAEEDEVGGEGSHNRVTLTTMLPAHEYVSSCKACCT